MHKRWLDGFSCPEPHGRHIVVVSWREDDIAQRETIVVDERRSATFNEIAKQRAWGADLCSQRYGALSPPGRQRKSERAIRVCADRIGNAARAKHDSLRPEFRF